MLNAPLINSLIEARSSPFGSSNPRTNSKPPRIDPHYPCLLLEEGLLIEGVALSLALDLVHLTGSRLAVVLLRF